MAGPVHLHRTWLASLLRHLGRTGSWRYAEPTRDLRLDFLRGFAVCAMLVDHIGGEPSWLYVLTGGNRFFVSVAELFVAISGFLVGSIYATIIARQGLSQALRKCLQRTWKLYSLTVLLTLGYASLALVLGFGWAPQLTAETWPAFLLSVLTLQRTFEMTDILLLYTLLLLATMPVLSLLAHGATAVVLAGTWSLWGLWQIAPQYAQVPWPIIDNTIFHFAPWQALFMSALVLGYHRQRLTPRLAQLSPYQVLWLSGLLVLGSIALYTWEPASPELTALLARLFDKPNLAPGRLLAFVSFLSFAWTLLTLAWQPLARALNWLLLPLGQQALPAYTWHLVILALLRTVACGGMEHTSATVWSNMALQVLGVGCLWSVIVLQAPLLAACRSGLQTLQRFPAPQRLRLYSLGTRTATLCLGLLRTCC